MRFPDEDDYRWAGALKRLWYKIICPFTFGARLWMVTTSILCALAVVQSANGSWGYHGRAQDTGFLSSNYINGVRLAWEIDAADAGLDRIDDYIARDGHLFIVGYKGTQRIAIGYDASYATPRELWRTDINDDETDVHWWDGDLLVGNTLVSAADGHTTTGWPTSGVRYGVSPYEHPSHTGWSSAPIGPIRLYCPDLSTGHCEAWDKTATHVWDFDASSGSFPDTVTPVDGWIPIVHADHLSRYQLTGFSSTFLRGFLNLSTGERTGIDAIKEACGPATTELDDGTTSCRITFPYIGAPPIIRAQDGWVISSGYMHAATVAPDGSNAQVVTLTQEAVARINYLSTYPQTKASLPTTEQIVHYAATGDHSWDTTITLTEGSAIIVNDSVTLATYQQYLDVLSYDASWWWAAPAISQDTSVLLIPHLKGASSSDHDLDSWHPSLINVSAAAQASTLPKASSTYRLSNDAVHGWNNLRVRSATPLYDDLIVARISPETSPWYKRLLGLTPSSGDRIVGLTPAPGPMRSAR